jgi:mRNA-degrading endonuclease RelE of RelBE toxin-antitoxin system
VKLKSIDMLPNICNVLRKKERIKDVLKRLEVTPLEQPDVRHMVGEWAGYHRIRVGKLRIIFVDEMAAFHTIQAALIHSGGIPNGDIR